MLANNDMAFISWGINLNLKKGGSNMKKGLFFLLVALACGVFITSCAPKYVHTEDPTFMFNYPKAYEPDQLRFKEEVARFSAKTQYKIPTYVAQVLDKPKGLSLKDTGKFVVKNTQKQYPGTSRFEILEEKPVKLSDGSDAQAIKFKWKWMDRVSTLKTAGVIAFKGDKVIYLSGTDLFTSDVSLDDLLNQCMTLSLK